MKTWFLTLAIAGILTVPASAATILFSDDFSADTAGLAKTTLTNWNLLGGTNVDVGGFAASCGPAPAQCIDTQGSGGSSNADIQTKNFFTLLPGHTYDLLFTMANTGGLNSFLVTLGSFSQLISTDTTADGAKDFAFTVVAPTLAKLEIADQGPADNVGVAIGHIQLIQDAAPSTTPEPGTLGLTGLAAGLLWMVRRKVARG